MTRSAPPAPPTADAEPDPEQALERLRQSGRIPRWHEQPRLAVDQLRRPPPTTDATTGWPAAIALRIEMGALRAARQDEHIP